MARSDPLKAYKAKRDFSKTAEPENGGAGSRTAPAFVVQKHWASHLHYDFRLELDGVLRSWAVPKGPSLDPKDKRMAVQVEDHPLAYKDFEGEIPAHEYGGGKVAIWDEGDWQPRGDPHHGLREGSLKFALHGRKLRGNWVLIRMKGKRGGDGPKTPWLLIKELDDYAQRGAGDATLAQDAPARAPRRPARRGQAPEAPAAGRARAKAPQGLPPGAVKAALPARLAPQLATLVEQAPADSVSWLYEIKYDGYRLLARIQGSRIALMTRNGNDWSGKLPALVQALRDARLPSGWYDGEIVMPGADGVPDFQTLQGGFDREQLRRLIYFLFDLPHCAGYDLRPVPFAERRAVLQALLERAPSGMVRLSEALDGSGGEIAAAACRRGLEGVIGKRKEAPYVAGRSLDWIKLKCSRRQEFVVGGYTDPQGSRSGFGALLLGVHDDKGALRYAGKVGTGFDAATLNQLKRELARIETGRSPFAAAGRIGSAHWVEPKLLAEVAFAEWTRGGSVRHAVFLGLRRDKPARAIVREQPVPPPRPERGALPPGLRITHPEREIDAASGASKLDLLRYYAEAAPLMMPHLAGRPVTLLRAPEGVDGQTFVQKHPGSGRMAGVAQLAAALDPSHPRLLEIARPEGLLSAAQMNVIEFHTWNAVKSAIGRPDRMIFDLDPGEQVEWARLRECALLLKTLLDELGLASFLKTSGGKGLHVALPLEKRYDWATVREFSLAVVEQLAHALPDHFTAKGGAQNRVGKVYVDYRRNDFAATTVCAWSVRARPGLGISVPLDWSELDAIGGGAHWHIDNIRERMALANSPWEAFPGTRQKLDKAMRRLGCKPARRAA